jgi:hypothetical protein
MFHAGFCRALGIRLESGIRADLSGVVGGKNADLWYHRIKILIGSYQVTTMAGFSTELSVAGLLGRRGFFEEFIVKIDSSVNPPSFEVDKINRA